MSISKFPLKLRHCQRIDAVVLGMGSDELHEGDLAAEIESNNQTIVSSSDLEPDALAAQHLGLRSRFLHLVHQTPIGGSDEFVQTLKQNFCLRMFVGKADEQFWGNDSHGT